MMKTVGLIIGFYAINIAVGAIVGTVCGDLAADRAYKRYYYAYKADEINKKTAEILK